LRINRGSQTFGDQRQKLVFLIHAISPMGRGIWHTPFALAGRRAGNEGRLAHVGGGFISNAVFFRTTHHHSALTTAVLKVSSLPWK
jgi:hypothetical protein